jgi:ribosomal protein S18 acetylase RimI-like enzyme
VKKLVVRTSQLAYKFFERLGYHLIRTEKDYWGKGLDLYLMEQVIN